MKKKNKLDKLNFVDVLIYIFFAIILLIILFPFYNSILISIVPQVVYFRTPLMLYPKTIDWSSYKFVFSSGTILGGMRVTSIITVFGVLYNMTLTVTMAFALSKPFPGRKLVLVLVIITMYFSGGMIPNYLLIKNLGLMDTLASMILPTGVSFTYMIIIKKNFSSIPPELEESASLEGAGYLTILTKIMLPLSLPVLATFSLFYSVQRWNEWWQGMLYIKTVGKIPLQLVLRNIIMEAGSVDDGSATDVMVFGNGVKMASMIISMIPIMCVYPFLQKYFVSGLTAGAVKG